ncbi:MAG: expansin EXLX1 family cellulose-binding protein [Bacteroidia bacterium]|nr:expansin EXLX1 family cellulose-binding protein [Bacteroidia bacterium]
MVLAIIALLLPESNAQPFLISFAGSGASVTVNSVNVDNVTKGTLLVLNGTDILRLNLTTAIEPGGKEQSPELKIYPNPMTEGSMLQFSPSAAGEALISVTDMSGKTVFKTNRFLDGSPQTLRISGLKDGFYLVNINGINYSYSGKLLCVRNNPGRIRIEKISDNMAAELEKEIKDTKGTEGIIDMDYTTGDLLKYSGISGIYTTIITDVPSSDKTVTFTFSACTDGDNNNYPVVQIGSQIWMAENLRTTKLNDGISLTLESRNDYWSWTWDASYCWYDNNETANKNTYGALYNWYSINTGRLCPAGWRLPTNTETASLVSYLGTADAGSKLKEAGTSHWTGNTGATNESGFKALPGGYRDGNDGVFSGIGNNNYMWGFNEDNINNAWSHYLTATGSELTEASKLKQYGYSVRCIKNAEGEFSGRASYVEFDLVSTVVACSFPASTLSSLTYAAVNTVTYNASAMCGACITVTSPTGSSTYKVSDCNPGAEYAGDLDFSEDGFALLENISQGITPIIWYVNPCPITDPVRFYFSPGSSEFWVSLTVLDHKNLITKVEVYKTGAWITLTREESNLFEGTDLGSGPLRIRITDINSNVIEEPSIAILPGQIVTGTQQF